MLSELRAARFMSDPSSVPLAAEPMNARWKSQTALTCSRLTADHVSGLGEGNTHAGMEKLNRLFPKSAKSHAEPKEHKRASGGKVPIYAADGEYVVHPEDIKDRYGDLDYGHKVLDAWQEHERKHLIHTLSNLDGPEKD